MPKYIEEIQKVYFLFILILRQKIIKKFYKKVILF